MPLESVDLASFDVSLGTDVFTYYNEVLISMTVTAAHVIWKTVAMKWILTYLLLSGGQNNDDAMDRFQILDRDYPVDNTYQPENTFASGEGVQESPLASGGGHRCSTEVDEPAAGFQLSSCSGQGATSVVSVIHGMLFGRAVTGCRSLVFTSDIQCLIYSAGLHRSIYVTELYCYRVSICIT
ncbi:hypothetical protein F5146DRAFT_1138979 [Armillaria mellea]|nr:hypothetical protein F5146DRAFT_1138979 [Armillaria mellea]